MTNGSPLFRPFPSFAFSQLIMSPPAAPFGLSKDSCKNEKQILCNWISPYNEKAGIKISIKYFLEYRQHLLDIFEGLCCQLKRYLILDHQPLHCHSMKTCCYSCRQKNSLKGYTIRKKTYSAK